MQFINKKTLKYTIINGNFSAADQFTEDMRSRILTANAIIYDAYININFLNALPLRPSCFFKVQLDEFYEDRMKHVNRLIIKLAYRFGHVVHLKGLSHLFFEDFYPSIQFVRSHNIEIKTINLNLSIPESLLN